MDTNFLWGSANSAYQIEGAYNEIDKAESMWDYYSHMAGSVVDNSNGDIACDFYHRFDDDIKLLKALGVNAYRLSLNWSRIIKDCKTQVSQIGLNFYSDVIDLLLMNDITPIIDFYDFNLPLKLQIEAGVLSPEFVNWISFYLRTITKAYGRRVKYWIICNDPEVCLGKGYQQGTFPPYLKVRPNLGIIAYKSLIKTVNECERIIKANVLDCRLIISSYFTGHDNKSSKDLTNKDIFKFKEENFLSVPGLYLDTLINRSYSKAFKTVFNQSPNEDDKDLAKSLYKPQYIQLDIDPSDDDSGESVYNLGKLIFAKYKLPIIVSPYGRKLDTNTLTDTKRVKFLNGCLESIKKLIKEGITVKGFIYGTFLDGFEWSKGYSLTRGLVQVDRSTLLRKEKDSYFAYQKIIKEN